MRVIGRRATVKRWFRIRPLAVALAMMMIHIASKELTWAGTIDRLIQFAFAYVLVAWAMKPKDGRECPKCGEGE